MEKPTGLFLIISNNKFRYCLYRVCEPESNGNDDVICTLDEPIMKLQNKSCPDGMSFASVGTNIFMVGGYYARSRSKPYRLSKETIIFDTQSNTYASGPPLISPKPDPFLFTVGSKLFALSCDIYTSDIANPFVGPKPRFEVLDTENLDSGWRALSVPRLYVTQQHNLYPVVACVGLSNGIFISVEDAGTYAFDLDNEVWNYVSKDGLPFNDQALPMLPNLPGAPPSLCVAASTKGYGYSAFHICYEDKHLFKVDEIEFGSSLLNLETPLPPEIYYKWPVTATDNGSLVYFIDSGLDNPDANNTNNGNRYVKVQACDVKFSKGQLFKSHGSDSNPQEFCKKRRKVRGGEKMTQAEVENYGKSSKSLGKKKLERDSNSGTFLKKCTSSEPKRELEDDEDKAEAEDTGKLLKVGRSTMKRRKKREKVETLEFKLNPIWRRSFFGGPMVDIGQHVYAAFAI
ncbi:uncharacterized protein LOC141655762 [Silene latifolia]|uniref:uncharacterized protein LOC141655762 n=1 Tax=Silene latifolia TaxID=37657 RepID=UPI003D77DCAA